MPLMKSLHVLEVLDDEKYFREITIIHCFLLRIILIY